MNRRVSFKLADFFSAQGGVLAGVPFFLSKKNFCYAFEMPGGMKGRSEAEKSLANNGRSVSFLRQQAYPEVRPCKGVKLYVVTRGALMFLSV